MNALPVLMYHHVTPAPGLVTVSPDTFRAQMAWLARHGYRSVGVTDLAAFFAGQPLPAKSVMITFDDGYLDNWVYAHPVLAEFGLSATLFVVTGWLGEGAPRPHAGQREAPAACPGHRDCMARIQSGAADEVMLRWSEVDAMRAAGTFEFHSHTHTHTRWDKQIADPLERSAHLAADLLLSRQTLTQRLGDASAHLCWPQGYHDADYRRVAADAGFTHLYTVEKRANLPGDDPQHIGRVVVKDKAGPWFASRLWLYRQGLLGRAYVALRGR